MAIGTGAAILGGALVGGVNSLVGSSKAASATSAASDAAAAEQRRQFNQLREDQAPYRALGNAALDRISSLYGYGPLTAPAETPQGAPVNWLAGGPFYGYGEPWTGVPQALPATGVAAQAAPASPDMSVFFESPDYRFNLAEGQKALDRSLAARGRALSGAGVREGIRYASGLASNEFGNFYNRLASQAGLGQSSVQNTGAAGMQAAGNIGNALMSAGDARANAYMQGAQGINNAIQGGLGNWLWGRGRGIF